MKAKLVSDILEMGDLEFFGRATGAGAGLDHLLARIARRPGRWRRRMSRRERFEDESHLDNAA